ncbi:MAG: DUF4240 domain-containing protein [Candidatus Melainabacteria bacterium]|nr:DUF4240 domain-containing protein [Candidatus Melainabacteria bacterium]
MVFFDKEAQELRARWKAIDVKAINFVESPFGLTEDGLQDFRGYTVRGTLGDEHIISKKRFEKCDLSFSQFVHCKIIDSWFVSSKLYAADFHSCQVISCPMPNCMTGLWVRYQAPEPPFVSLEEHTRLLLAGIDQSRIKVRTRAQLELIDLDRAVVFCLSMQSAPSSEAFIILAKLLASSVDPPPLVVLSQDEFSNRSKRDREQLKILFDGKPSGLAEVAWIQSQKVIASDCLARLPIRETVIERLGLIGCRAQESSTAMSEERFWEIVDLANPYERPYLPKAHAERLMAVFEALSDRELELFEIFRDSLSTQIYSFDMATAASTIGTGCSDDSFIDFCAALVYRGKYVFYAVLETTEEALLNLDGAHYMLAEGFGYIVDVQIERRPELKKTLSKVRRRYLGSKVGFGGVPIDDEEKAFRKRYPKLFKKYWDKEEYQLNYALSLDCDSVEG